MFFGATSSARSSGPRLVDLNLVPAEFRPRPFPLLSIGLAVLAVGCALLLYAAYYAKTYTELEVAHLTSRVNQAETLVKAATGDPAALARTDQLRAMRNDFGVLAQREINWGDVFQTIGDAPPGVVVNTISQAGFGVTVTGSASNSAAAALYLNKLRASKLFIDAALQVNPAAATATPTETPVRPTPQPPSPVAPPPAIQPIKTVAPIHTLAATRPTAPVAPPPVAPTMTSIPTITTTPSITPTSTPTTTSTPAYDFALLSTQQIPTSNPLAGSSDIKGTVVDLDNQPIGGLTIEIDSEGSPAWSITRTTDPTYGSFDFSVTHGKFKVYVVGGRSQPAVDLYTGADGVPGVYGYQLSFQATFTGTPPPEIVGTATGTLTPTATTTPSDTPISLGQNIASWGCANAYLQNSPGTHLGNNANLAIDRNYGSEWNAGVAPSNGNQIIWQWSLPSGPLKCNDGRTAAGLPDSQDQIEGFQLIPDQNPAGPTDHELWLYSDPGCLTNLHTDNSAYFIWSGDTSAGQILPLHISPPVMVRCIIVRTIADPSFVAWEEIQIYQAVPPPQGFPSLTATPTNTETVSPTWTGTPATATNTPSPTITPTGTVTQTGTTTATGTITPTGSPTPTLTPLNIVAGQNVAPTSGVIISSPISIVCASTPTPPANSVCNAIDNNRQTSWAPNGAQDPQGIKVSLAVTQIPNPDSIGDLRVEVQSLGTPSGVTYEVSANPQGVSCIFQSPPNGYVDHTQLDCPFTTPIANVQSATLLIYRNGSQDGSYGVREFQIYDQVPLSHALSNCQVGCPATPVGSGTQVVATPGTPLATRTATPTIARIPAGRGRGPGDTTVFAPNSQASNNAQAVELPSPTPDSGTPIAPAGGPVDFTIVLEVASGSGY